MTDLDNSDHQSDTEQNVAEVSTDTESLQGGYGMYIRVEGKLEALSHDQAVGRIQELLAKGVHIIFTDRCEPSTITTIEELQRQHRNDDAKAHEDNAA